jgi:cell division protein FtsB
MSLIPPELLSLVTEFKNFVSQQKTVREENCQRFSVTPIVEVEKHLEHGVLNSLHKIELDLHSKGKLVESLRGNTEVLLKDAELVNRLLKTDYGFNPTFVGATTENQLANPSAKKYFSRQIEAFEGQMQAYSRRIKELEQQLNNLNKTCTPEELILTMKKQHEALIALAAEVYMVHEEIAKLKKHDEKASAEDLESRLKMLGN